MREEIERAIEEALQALSAGEVSFVVERPKDFAHGDYSTNAALVARTDPHELAAKLHIKGVEKVEVVGKFINFFLSREAIIPKEQSISQLYAGKKVLVEYTSPNLFKPLHIGNLVGNVLGESVARLLEIAGADVKRLNYPSDIGLTVAKGVWGLKTLSLDAENITELGKAYVAGNEAYENNPDAKREIEDINQKLYEDSDPGLSALRKKGVETSRAHLDDLCEVLGTKFDREFFESESGPLGSALVRANAGPVFEESEGAVVYRGEQDGLHTRVFLNSQGLPTYEAKELGLFELKSNAYPDFNISITVTGGEQSEFFKVVFAAVKKVFAQKIAGKTLQHVTNGFLKLTTGKMSSRKGNIITGESLLADLIGEAKVKMHGRELPDVEKTAEQIAVGAIKYAVLRQGSGRDIVFDPEKSLSLEGDSGPYLQYALVRARSLLRNSAEKSLSPAAGQRGDASENDFSASKPSGPERPLSSGLLLERLLIHFPEVLVRAAQELEPHYVTTYLTELAGAFNSWYSSGKILGSVDQEHGLFLTNAVEKTLAKGLHALGIPAPEEM